MNSLNNSVRLTGFSGSTPKVKVTDSEKKVAKLSLATNSSRKNAKGERVNACHLMDEIRHEVFVKFRGIKNDFDLKVE